MGRPRPAPMAAETAAAVGALRRAVHLLDRALATGPKVKAFQRAAEVVAALAPAELVARHRAGTLTDLAGIGPSTAAVITGALDGVTSAYLADLEATTAIAVTEPGAAELRAALRGDCHSHTRWSDGGASVAEMAITARDLGHEYLVVTDHSPRLTIAHGLSPERLGEQLDEIAVLNEHLAPFRILTGMEVDILDDGGLDLPDELLARLDLVVASVHRKLSMPERDMTVRMVKAIANPHTDVLGHCTGRKVPGAQRPVGRSGFAGRAPSAFDPDLVFAACARFDVAVEVNSRPERLDPPDDLLARAVEWGCSFAIDTDAHAPGQLEWQVFGCDIAARVGVPAPRIINSWSAEALVAWSADKAA